MRDQGEFHEDVEIHGSAERIYRLYKEPVLQGDGPSAAQQDAQTAGAGEAAR